MGTFIAVLVGFFWGIVFTVVFLAFVFCANSATKKQYKEKRKYFREKVAEGNRPENPPVWQDEHWLKIHVDDMIACGNYDRFYRKFITIRSKKPSLAP